MAEEDARIEQLRSENDRLQRQLEEANETLEAIRCGEVDALVINKGGANQVFTLEGADHPYRMFVEEMHQGAVTLSQGFVVLFCNDRFTKMMQYQPEQITGTPFGTFVHPASGSSWQALMDRAETGRAEAELQLQREDGTTFPVLVAVSVTQSAHGSRLILVVSDLTEQKQHERLQLAEKDLLASQLRLRRIIDGVLEAIVVVDDAGRFLDANLAAERVFGVEPDGLIGWNISEFKEPGNHLENVWQRLQEGTSPLIEFQICRSQGTLIDAEAYYVPAILPGRHLLVVHDITERKLMEKQRAELEAQIQQVKKQEALAVLAGGVAHDFNNLLATMLGNANLASMVVEPDSKVMSYMAAIEKAAMRAAKLTRQMVAYTGQGKYHKGEVDLNLVLREAMLHFSDSMPPQVNVHLLLSDRLPFVQGDSTQFSEILVNLLTNAVEAMEPGRGSRLLLRTRGEYLDQAAIDRGSWALPVAQGYYTTVEVVDEGIGMGPDVVDRLFEPFFSTKFAGRGLGLAEVIGVVRNHGGGVQVQSEPGKGSSFKIFLPSMRAPRSAHPRESSPAWRGEGQILVVDDEKDERNKVRGMAEELGFTVIEAANGMAAVELFRLRHGDLALVLLDLSLPLADARVALGEIQKIDINVPVVVGCPYWEKEGDLPVEVQVGSLRKPYRLAEFRGLLQRTLA